MWVVMMCGLVGKNNISKEHTTQFSDLKQYVGSLFFLNTNNYLQFQAALAKRPTTLNIPAFVRRD
jgi:hypothetical protein